MDIGFIAKYCHVTALRAMAASSYTSKPIVQVDARQPGICLLRVLNWISCLLDYRESQGSDARNMDYEETQQQSPSRWIKDSHSIHHCQTVSLLEVEIRNVLYRA